MAESSDFDSRGQSEDECFDAIILGAGITGLVSASILHDLGCRRVAVIDEFQNLGGNHIDRSINEYTFDIGSLVFQDDSPLLKYFPELLEHYVPIKPTWGKLTPQAFVTSYPLSIRDDIVRAGPWGIVRIVLSAALSRLARRKIGNAREFARYWIGDYLLRRSGLESYMKRFFGVPADWVDLEFAEKRMLWIKEHASPRVLLRYVRRHRAPGPTNRQLARPREGFNALYEVAARTLRQRGSDFHLGQRIVSITRRGTQFDVRTESGRFTANRLISTIPIPRALSLCGIQEDPGLESVTLISLYFSFSGTRGFDCSILYNFAHDGAWKRLTMYSDFYGRVEGREYFGVEVIAGHAGDSVTIAEQDFRAHVAKNGLFTGDLVCEGSQMVPCAYPIYTGQAHQRVARARAQLSDLGIESFGRQGGFDYQPTARVSTLNAAAHLMPTGTSDA
ncbi:FAD-dependent oxidoreductase [Methylobacterium mesophilicum]|uniref:FAD-dependent oxidoreductase n=1 Tax=Methylobacterium mesophilicum TaxID=39956 RepID=UPI002F33ACA7